MKRNIFLSALLALAALTSCGGPEATIPAQSEAVTETAAIYPDYRDIVVPPNIAPLDIKVKSAGDEFVGCIEGAGKQVLAAAGKDGKLDRKSVV